MQRIKILLDFDHELPLGGVKTNYNEALFKPTDNLIERANKLNVKINLFSDILSAYRFKEWDKEDFYIPYSEQLKKAINYGNDVQLHIHPHWLTSKFSNNQFQPSSHFKLADFNNKNNFTINEIIKLGKQELNQICSSVNKSYQCIAYRAGGFNMAPDTNEIIKALFQNGIVIDGSIPKEIYFESDVSTVDYRGFNKKANWFIQINKGLDYSIGTDGILEVPIATSPGNLYYLAKHVIRKKLYSSNRPLNHGKTIHHGKTHVMKKINSLLSARLLGFDIFTDTPEGLMKILKHHLAVNSPNHKGEYVVGTVSHPKNMGKYALDLMEGFIKRSQDKYGEQLSFCAYQDIYKDYFLSGVVLK